MIHCIAVQCVFSTKSLGTYFKPHLSGGAGLPGMCWVPPGIYFGLYA